MDQVIPNPLIMIASDGAAGHPRNAGTYSRVLAQYVREKGSNHAHGRAAQDDAHACATAGEVRHPPVVGKGRLQEGADADVVVFDPTDGG